MILGIDYGQKNIGVAVSDEYHKLALGLKTFNYKDFIMYLQSLTASNSLEKIVVGYPLKENQEIGKTALLVDKFISSLQLYISKEIEIYRVEESMSSQLAIQTLRSQGYTSKQIMQKKDTESARIILQDYLNSL